MILGFKWGFLVSRNLLMTLSCSQDVSCTCRCAVGGAHGRASMIKISQQNIIPNPRPSKGSFQKKKQPNIWKFPYVALPPPPPPTNGKSQLFFLVSKNDF